MLASAIGAAMVKLDAHAGEDWRVIAVCRTRRLIPARNASNITNLTGKGGCES